MVEAVVRVLLVEDDEDDYLLTRELLADIPGRRFDLDWAASYEAGLRALRRGEHDVSLIDYRLDQRSGLELIQEVTAAGGDCPMILLTGLGDIAVDVEAMKLGASDYLVKGRIDADSLERSIRHAIERKRAELALRRMNEELERRVRARTAELERANAELAENDRQKNVFLATLGHELRNPLAPIANALAILDHEPDADTARQARQMIGRQLRHITHLVDDLLDVARITQGKITLRREPLELGTVVARAVEAVGPLVRDRRHLLVVPPCPEPLFVDADATRLEQVLTNLLTNAIKYTPEGGTITVSLERDGAQAVARVRDSGVGIPPDLLGSVFDLFVQADALSDLARGGLGLGLTLVRRLVEMHGGRVEAVSEGPGKGSEFLVRLPLCPDPKREEGRPKAAPLPPLPGGLRLLVVDDNIDAAESLAVLLRLDGHEVATAHDGRAALEMARTLRPGFVFLDIGLPHGMDGYEVARRLRQLPGLEDVTLIALTGFGQREDSQRSRGEGFHAHLVKPIDPDAIGPLLARLHSRRA